MTHIKEDNMTCITKQRHSVLRVCRRAGSLVLPFAVVLVAGIASMQSANAQSYKETVLYRFTGLGNDGANPYGGVVQDSQGNLYGTTQFGGKYNEGTVFKLNKSGHAIVLHSFVPSPEGWGAGTDLMLDSAGTLYGTTYWGGTGYCNGTGCGVVFKLDQNGKGYTVWHNFNDSPDGAFPYGVLAADGKGNVYGTTYRGGSDNYGTVFKIDATGRESVVHSFTDTNGDGADSRSSLILDSESNIYGTTVSGGSGSCGGDDPPGCGVVFKVSKGGKETPLYDFPGIGERGAGPLSKLARDTSGNLYGITEAGGSSGSGCGGSGCGTVFELDQTGKEKLLYSFKGGNDGALPQGGLLRDKEGNLYGATAAGGDLSCSDPIGGGVGCGVVFKVSPTGQETVLHTFKGGRDGLMPFGSLIWDAAGNIYGTTIYGGDDNGCGAGLGCGTVFELVRGQQN
jgi:uncharacterized repeat protein (TIGR03803 family)